MLVLLMVQIRFCLVCAIKVRGATDITPNIFRCHFASLEVKLKVQNRGELGVLMSSPCSSSDTT